MARRTQILKKGRQQGTAIYNALVKVCASSIKRKKGSKRNVYRGGKAIKRIKRCLRPKNGKERKNAEGKQK